MRAVSFPMPLKNWNGLHAPQYIVRSYAPKFAPTQAAVDYLNKTDKPQGLVYVLDEEYDGGCVTTRIIVVATEEEFFAKFAEPGLDRMDAQVREELNRSIVRGWYQRDTQKADS